MRSKLKILIIPSWYPSKENPIWGNYFIKQAGSLSNYADVSMLYINRVGLKNINIINNEKMSDGFNNKIHPFKFYKKTILNIKSINMGLSFYLYCRALYKAYKRYIKIIGKPDIILAQSALPAGLGALYISKKTKIPFVVHAHSIDVMNNPSYKKYIKKVTDNANGYMAVSKTVKEVLEKYERKDAKIVPNFIDTKRFNIKNVRKNKDFTLINICNFFKVKAVEVLIKAMDIIVHNKGITDIKLRIIGTGEYEEYYKKVRDDLELNDYVEFVGFIPNNEIPRIYASSHVICISSRSETFGIPIIEGMSSGIPSISTDCGGPSEIITNKTGIIVPVDNPKKYAEAILEMKKNYSNYKKEELKKYAYDNYDEYVICNKIMDILKEVIKDVKK